MSNEKPVKPLPTKPKPNPKPKGPPPIVRIEGLKPKSGKTLNEKKK